MQKNRKAKRKVDRHISSQKYKSRISSVCARVFLLKIIGKNKGRDMGLRNVYHCFSYHLVDINKCVITFHVTNTVASALLIDSFAMN
jgi:hypothetical protein